MTRKGHSVVFAALLLVAQLLFAVMSAGAMAHDGANDCGGCPTSGSSPMPYGMGGAHGGMADGGEHGGSHCGTHCSHESAPDTGNTGCGSGCTMMGSGHCGSPANPAAIGSASISPVTLGASFGSDRRSVSLPDSPLFDFLRPPTRA